MPVGAHRVASGAERLGHRSGTLGASWRRARAARAARRRALVGVVGPAHVLVDDAPPAGYEVDWTGRFRGRDAGGRAARVDRRGGRRRARVRRRRRGGRAPGRQHRAGRGRRAAGRRGRAVAAAPRRRGAGRRAGRPGHGRRRRHAGRGAGRAPARRARRRRRPGRPRHGDDRRHGRHQRRRPAPSSATARCGPRWPASRRCSPTARSSATSAGWRRTTPATTWPGCCAGARARSASSPRCGCGWCRRRTSG